MSWTLSTKRQGTHTEQDYKKLLTTCSICQTFSLLNLNLHLLNSLKLYLRLKNHFQLLQNKNLMNFINTWSNKSFKSKKILISSKISTWLNCKIQLFTMSKNNWEEKYNNKLNKEKDLVLGTKEENQKRHSN